MNNKIFLIIPGNDDQNRGDQALVWQTMEIAKASGCEGQYYMIAEEKLSQQSINKDIKIIEPIIKHPSRFFKNNKNISYGIIIKALWGFVAIFDLIYSKLVLSKIFQHMMSFISKKTRTTLSIIKKADVIFVKGGGFIHSQGGLIAKYKAYYQLFHINLALKMKKRVIVMPNSFGPFKSIEKIVYKTLSKCELLTCRENLSTKMLKGKLGITANTYPDLGFYLQKSDVGVSDVILNKLSTDKIKVGITLRPYRFEGDSNPAQKYIDYKNVIINFAKWLIENDYFPIFIEHVYNSNEHEKDILCIQDVTKELIVGDYEIISDRGLTCENLKYIYSQLNYLIGTRFHSVIFSISEKVKSIAISYGGNKGQGIMNDLGLSNYCIPIENIQYEALLETFYNLVNDDTYLIKTEINLADFVKKKESLIELIKETNENSYNK